MDEDRITWHYAVWKKSGYPFMSLACIGAKEVVDPTWSGMHGYTVVRGDVSCGDCKTMMGMT